MEGLLLSCWLLLFRGGFKIEFGNELGPLLCVGTGILLKGESRLKRFEVMFVIVV